MFFCHGEHIYVKKPFLPWFGLYERACFELLCDESVFWGNATQGTRAGEH